MPWTEKQNHLFNFVAHNPSKAKAEGIKIPQKTALRMAHEGIKDNEPKSAIKHLGRRKLA
jgi:hypothetical protein